MKIIKFCVINFKRVSQFVMIKSSDLIFLTNITPPAVPSALGSLKKLILYFLFID